MEHRLRGIQPRIQVFYKAEGQEEVHQDIELLYLLVGSLEVSFGEQKTTLAPEDVLVINANQSHRLKGSEDVLYVCVPIPYHILSQTLESRRILFWCDSTREQGGQYEKLRELLRKLLRQYLEARDFHYHALYFQLLDSLVKYFLVRAADREVTEKEGQFEERISQINRYIQDNYDQPISLKELSEQLYLSHGYLSRFFKQQYGMSFAEYLTQLRLHATMDELKYTDFPITRIALENGFANVAVFNKAFKKAYGNTPAAMRRNWKREQYENTKHGGADQTDRNGLGNAQIEERLQKYLSPKREEETEEERNREQALWKAEAKEQLWEGWGRTINIGSASMLLKSDIQEHVMLLKEALGFRYVRFWNVFSKELLLDVRETYNFGRLDFILDFLLRQGLKPHIELGMKPFQFFHNVQHMLREEEQAGFVEIKEWEPRLQAMMRHLVRRYGRKELSAWRMEVWFAESKWGQKGAAEEYYELFEKTYRIVKHYCEDMEVGGCGLRLDLSEDFRLDFLQGWGKRECLPDYLSISYFAYERGEIEEDCYSRRSLDERCLLHRVQRVKELVAETGLKNTKLYMSEWNLTVSARNFINDTCFKGAYVIKNVLDLYGEIEDMGFFLGSDRVSEYYDSRPMLYGGTGLFSKDGILKPAGFAFEFLNRLYPYFIGKGEHYLISTDQHGTYGIVCHNQRKLGYHYYLTKEDEIAKEHMKDYFEDRESLELDLALSGVENGTYQIKIYRINEQNGSVFDLWREMDFEKELSRNDIKYFRRMCEPKLVIQKQEAGDGTLKLYLRLHADEIAFVKLRLLEE